VENLGDLPVNFYVLEGSTTMRAGWLKKTLPDVRFVDLPCT